MRVVNMTRVKFWICVREKTPILTGSFHGKGFGRQTVSNSEVVVCDSVGEGKSCCLVAMHYTPLSNRLSNCCHAQASRSISAVVDGGMTEVTISASHMLARVLAYASFYLSSFHVYIDGCLLESR